MRRHHEHDNDNDETRDDEAAHCGADRYARPPHNLYQHVVERLVELEAIWIARVIVRFDVQEEARGDKYEGEHSGKHLDNVVAHAVAGTS